MIAHHPDTVTLVVEAAFAVAFLVGFGLLAWREKRRRASGGRAAMRDRASGG